MVIMQADEYRTGVACRQCKILSMLTRGSVSSDRRRQECDWDHNAAAA